ncbi:MAG: hypothetical protein P8164_12490 [Gammaproteobacteria bacterium]|jgi:hypothetical protein
MPSDEHARAALATDPFSANPWVEVNDEAIIIKAGYSETLQRLLRWVPKARWRADLRCWSVPLAGAELVRSVLPEISRLAEAMQETPGVPSPGQADTGEAAASANARAWFRDAARLLFGSDWQRETARALDRDEAALACWLIGEDVTEATPDQLLTEMLMLMRRRAEEIGSAADALADRIARCAQKGA